MAQDHQYKIVLLGEMLFSIKSLCMLQNDIR